MNKVISSNHIWLLILVLACSLGLMLLGGCGSIGSIIESLTESREIAVSAAESEYSFDANTIRQSIAAGQQNVFKLEWTRDLHRIKFETRTPETFTTPTPVPGRLPLAWSEADFERVVQASTKFSGKELIKDSRLYWIYFRTPCQLVDVGPQKMIFHFLKVLSSQEYKHYQSGSAVVNLETGRLTWAEAELSQVMSERQALDRGSAYIPAERAMRIAENSGGATFRRQLGNVCDVTGHLSEGVADSEWQLEYQQSENPYKKFVVQIDKKTEAGKVIQTQPP